MIRHEFNFNLHLSNIILTIHHTHIYLDRLYTSQIGRLNLVKIRKFHVKNSSDMFYINKKTRENECWPWEADIFIVIISYFKQYFCVRNK